MKIRLFNQKNLWLTCDDLQWIVCRYRVDESGKERMEDARYFAELSNALKYVADDLAKKCDSFKEMVDIIMRFKAWIESTIDFDVLSAAEAGRLKNEN